MIGKNESNKIKLDKMKQNLSETYLERIKLNKVVKLVFVTLFVFISFEIFAQIGGETCPQMQPICTGSPVQFTANDNGPDVTVSEPGNNYGCLNYSPNPSWYYLDIATAGD